MHLASYLGLLRDSEQALGDAFRLVAEHHKDEPDVEHLCKVLGAQATKHTEALEPVVRRYGEQEDSEPEQLEAAEFGGTREGGVGLLRDLQDLYALASFVDITWTVVGQAAQGLRDQELLDVVQACEQETSRQLTWLNTRIKQAAPQALIAAK
ncbi:hypothetical protein [Kribbella lupini]|uniref:Ferritin-like metal-binding protein YciE n=1 Tax=Kribbella lupini TaxID=291602 RepID=A0ABN2AIU3_9ACTN